MAPDSLNTTGGEIAVNGRRYRLPKQPVVVVCVDGSEPGYIEAAVEAGRAPWFAKVLTEGTRQAVRKLNEAGIGFTIVSSRPTIGMGFLVAPLGISLPLGAFNGSSIVDAALKPIEQHTIAIAVAQRSRAPKLSSVTELLDLLAAPLLAECTHVDPTPLPCPHTSLSGDRQKTDARDDSGGNGSCIAHEIARGRLFVAPCNFGAWCGGGRSGSRSCRGRRGLRCRVAPPAASCDEADARDDRGNGAEHPCAAHVVVPPALLLG